MYTVLDLFLKFYGLPVETIFKNIYVFKAYKIDFKEFEYFLSNYIILVCTNG